MKEKFYTPEEFNCQADLKDTNCLAYALGRIQPDRHGYDLPSSNMSIEEAFKKKASEYGIIVRKVESLNEAKGMVAFLVYGWYYSYTLFGIEFRNDFHVVRKERDGQFSHKFGWDEPASFIPNINEFEENEDYRNPQIFVLADEG